MDRFHKKLPKDDLKKFGKEVGKKIVESDYKNNRVEDPTTISAKQEQKVKQHVRQYLEKAVEKYRARERQRQKRRAEGKNDTNGTKASELITAQDVAAATEEPPAKRDVDGDNGDVFMTDDEQDHSPESSPISPSGTKRKREGEKHARPSESPSGAPSAKRLREDDGSEAPSPPPPPPPPAVGYTTEAATNEERCMREQEEALMRENEEAERLEDEAQHTKKLQRQEQHELVKREQAPVPLTSVSVQQ